MNIIADTCFWISLCDPSDKDHEETVKMMEKIMVSQIHHILVPHPVLYETFRTEMVKKPGAVKELIRYFKMVDKVPDIPYLQRALYLIERQAEKGSGSSSMVDFVIMFMAEDKNNRVKAILTRNGRDFASFCEKQRVIMINSIPVLEAL